MESNKLQTLEKNLPLRAYPKESLNKILIMDFLPFISNLLSLTDQKSADRLEVALPSIKEQCIGMGLAEIKKMFEMYADSKLSIEPIPNYFDRVLLGKIVNEYKFLKKPKAKITEMKPTEAEQERIMLDAVDRVKKEIKETKNIQGHAHHIYDFLVKSGRVEFSDAEKKASYNIAKRQLISEAKNKAIVDYDLHKIIDKTISEINKNGNSSVVAVAKKILLIDYLTKEK